MVLTGGAENMSQAPFVVRNVRFGTALGQKYEFEDMLWVGLHDSYCNLSMGMTAEKLGSISVWREKRRSRRVCSKKSTNVESR